MIFNNFGRVFPMSHRTRVRSGWKLWGVFVIVFSASALAALASPGEKALAVRALLDEGVRLFQARRYTEALNWFEKALQLDSQDADAELLSGRALLELKEPLEAIDHFQRSIELRPSEPSAQIPLCRAYLELARFLDAATACRKASETVTTSAFAFSAAGNAFFELGRFDEAREMFQRAIVISPEDATAYSNLSSTQAAMGQLPEAAESVRTAIRLRPDFADARIKLGFYLIGLCSYREGIATLQQAIDDNLGDERAYMGIAIAEKDLGQFNKAIQAARKATTLSPSLALAHYILGIVEFEIGDTRSALAVRETLNSLDPALAEDYGRYLRSRFVVSADGLAVGGSNR